LGIRAERPPMFYRPENGHGLPHNPFKAVVSPRPIAWISTRGANGADNLAPYSFFNAVADDPPQVMFASSGAKPDRDGTKDTLAQIRETGVFCINIVSHALMDAMNTTSGTWQAGVDEFAVAGLDKADCTTIPCPRVAAAPASLECRMTQMVPMLGNHNTVIFAEVTGIHLSDDCIVDGRFDVTRYQPVARLGYHDYAVVREVFGLARPKV
jgi:flavin reductase (DIM6/NTAB) family NADH-FMN oxidoreductase RutF